jgi:hypothetical protein
MWMYLQKFRSLRLKSWSLLITCWLDEHNKRLDNHRMQPVRVLPALTSIMHMACPQLHQLWQLELLGAATGSRTP